MEVKGLKAVFLSVAFLLPFTGIAEPTDSFSKAKKLMMNQVYFDHRETLYCGAAFDQKKQVKLPAGFHTEKHVKRAKKVEWEGTRSSC
jgi:deoxyribonuclease-1